MADFALGVTIRKIEIYGLAGGPWMASGRSLVG